MLRPLAPSALALVLVAACGGADDGSAASDAGDGLDGGRDCTPVVGDVTQPLEVRPVYLDEAGAVRPLTAGGPVTLIPPIQGGYVLMIGLEARNVRGCGTVIEGTLRDPATGISIAGESRPSQLVVGADGWGHLGFPASATSANLSTCPGFMLPRDVDGSAWRLELALVEDTGRRATWTGEVTPTCDPSGRDPVACACQCDSQFQFGQPCPTD